MFLESISLALLSLFIFFKAIAKDTADNADNIINIRNKTKKKQIFLKAYLYSSKVIKTRIYPNKNTKKIIPRIIIL